MLIIVTQDETTVIVFFIEGGRKPSKEKIGCLSPATMMSWVWQEASVAFRFKTQTHPQAYGDNQDYTFQSCLANYLVPY